MTDSADRNRRASRPYRGRFAPTPSGPLHFGSLIAAVGSYLDARAHGGQWLVRIEDLDPPRVVAGAADDILRTLEAFGFGWDGDVVYQSARTYAYRDALARLQAQGLAYPCRCTRKQIAEHARIGPAGPIYPGTCRGQRVDGGRHSWRVDTRGARIAFDDAVQGRVAVDLEAELGDFVVRRADGLFAYHLASVVDDAEAGVTDVVRGQDLLPSTAPQIYLQRLLGLPTPRYLHLPLALNELGQKLSKQTYAPALEVHRRAVLLCEAMTFLGHPPPPHAADGGLDNLWQWAIAAWNPAHVPQANRLSPSS